MLQPVVLLVKNWSGTCLFSVCVGPYLQTLRAYSWLCSGITPGGFPGTICGAYKACACLPKSLQPTPLTDFRGGIKKSSLGISIRRLICTIEINFYFSFDIFLFEEGHLVGLKGRWSLEWPLQYSELFSSPIANFFTLKMRGNGGWNDSTAGRALHTANPDSIPNIQYARSDF